MYTVKVIGSAWIVQSLQNLNIFDENSLVNSTARVGYYLGGRLRIKIIY